MLVNIHDAKTHFSKLINKVLMGEEVIIAKGGKPLVHLVPYVAEKERRVGGQFKGLMHVSEDFDASLPEEVLKQFYKDEK